MAFTRDREKLKTLVHYTIWECKNPAILGAIKLNKVPWMSDLCAYVHWGRPITGEHYRKGQFGPIAMSMVGIVEELKREGKIAVREGAYGSPKVDYFALTRPDISAFTPDEISLIRDCIDYVCRKHTSLGISDRTHDKVWELAELGEEIPYEAMLASRLGEVTEDDVNWAREAISQARAAEAARHD
jgi:hypothetical protein